MIDGRIKFRHLQCFLAVANHASVQKAAVALSLTQPAVSKTIKELEEFLNILLFDRGYRGMQMTQRAEVFFTYAEAAVNALQQAAEFMGPAKKTPNSVIRIGATPSMTVSFVPQVLMAFERRVPNVQVSILTGETGYLLEQLREDEFDLILCRHLDAEQMVGFSFEFLYADPLVVVVRPGHPLLTSPTDKEGKPHRFISILPPKTSINRRAASPLAMAFDLRPIAHFVESRSISFGRTYTLNSDAVWFVPWCAVKLDVEQGTLVKLTPPAKAAKESIGQSARSTGLMMRSNFTPSTEMQTLIEVMRENALAGRS
jgi:LysR family pca operon transcriptional activator